MRQLSLAFAAVCLLPVVALAEEFPRHVLARGDLKLTLYLPDAARGYYRGTRFDWSGVVALGEWKGHTFFGPWKTGHDPLNHDDIAGAVEEFGIVLPVGYADTKVGTPFVKIGVGLLEKIEEKEYRFWYPYKLVKPGEWTVTTGDDRVTFVQDLMSPGGHGYHYTKTVRLAKDGDGFAIDHVLKSTGTRPLVTDHYCHHFLVFDRQPVGPDYEVEFGFDPKLKKPMEGAELKGRRLAFTEVIPDGKSVMAELTGWTGKALENQFTARNKKTGMEVHVRGDKPLTKFNCWSVRTTMCPEPFIGINVQPGKEMSWTTEYTFAEKRR
jgi:hypothetical protein